MKLLLVIYLTALFIGPDWFWFYQVWERPKESDGVLLDVGPWRMWKSTIVLYGMVSDDPGMNYCSILWRMSVVAAVVDLPFILFADMGVVLTALVLYMLHAMFGYLHGAFFFWMGRRNRFQMTKEAEAIQKEITKETELLHGPVYLAGLDQLRMDLLAAARLMEKDGHWIAFNKVMYVGWVLTRSIVSAAIAVFIAGAM